MSQSLTVQVESMSKAEIHDAINDLHREIGREFNFLENHSGKNLAGKSLLAGERARKSSVKLRKMLATYRLLSVEYNRNSPRSLVSRMNKEMKEAAE